MLEIEKKFLAKIDLDLLERPYELRRRQQLYLTAGNPEVRVSRYMQGDPLKLSFGPADVVENSYSLAIKKGEGFVREEVEFKIDPRHGESIFNMISPSLYIDKVRVKVGRWEIDIFGSALSGLVMAEIELEDTNENLPDTPVGLSLLEDVTGITAFSNKKLATAGLSISTWLHLLN
jgi:CYTH domain-containing protein